MDEPKKITLDSKQGIGIVLSGGGAGGAYEAGVIKALKEAGVKFKLAAGTSAGALNASLIAADKIDQMVKLWEDISQKKVLSIRPKLKRGALLSDDPLEKLIRAEIDEKAAKEIIDSSIKLIVISSDLRNKQAIVDEDFKNYEQIIKSLMSSCSIPVVFPFQELSKGVNDKKLVDQLVDGGIVNNFPIKEAIETGLCKNFFTVSLFVPEVENSEDKEDYMRNLFHIGMRALEIIFTNSYMKQINEVKEKIVLANSLKEMLDTKISTPNILSPEIEEKIKRLYEEYKIYEGINIIEINPKKRLSIGILDFAKDKIKKAMEMGYEDAKEKLKNIEILQ